MKRFRKVMLVVILFISIFMLTGCGNKKAITSEDYKNKMEEKKYSVQESTSQFSDYDYVKKVYIALNSDRTYQIEFYELSDVDNAVSFFNNNKTIFENSKSNDAVETSVSMGNNSKYTLTTNGRYKVVSRIDNTVIYLDVTEQYKNDVQSILKSLGY